MAQYSVFGPRASSSSQPFALDDFLPPQSGEEHEPPYDMDSGDSGFSRAGPNGGGGRRPNGSILQQKAPPPSTAANGGLPLLDASVEEERVRDASLLILPLLLANPPSIPSHMKSTEVRQRHQLLSISPNDIDDYLVTPSPSSPSDVKSRVIAGLDALKGSVEQLAGILATDTDAMEHIVRTVRWASPEPGNVQANVLLGDDDAEHLALILKREEEPTGRREPWRFHNLLPAGEAPGNWCDDLARAQKRRAPTPPSKPSGLSVQWRDRDGAASNDAAGRSRSLTSNATTRTAGSYNTADEGEREQEHDQHDGTPAEEKFTTADDFWGGWDDNVEGGDDDGDAGESREVIKQTAGADEAAAEAAYWASYDASDPHADSLRRDAEEAERQKQMDLDTVSQMGSVNFDGLERRMDHPASVGPGSDVYAVGAESAVGGANEPIHEEDEDVGHQEEAAHEEQEQEEGERSMDSEHSRRSIDAVPPPLDSGSMPTAAYEKVQKMFDASQDTTGSHTGDRDAPMSPRSDATSMGLTDEGEHFTADNTTVDVEELDRAATGKPGAEEDGEDDGEQEGQSPFEPVAEEPDAEEEEAEQEQEQEQEADDDQEDNFVEAPTTPQPVPEDNHSSPRKTRKDMIGIEDLAAAQQQQQQPRKKGNNTLFPPAPMSVSAQSVFETPADMSLADLEAFYRSRDHQRMLEAKERLARMHRDSRESMTEEKPKQHQHRAARGKAAGSDDDEDSDHDSDIVSEAESALQEARSAIGSVMSEYTSAPSRSAESQQDKQQDTLEEEEEPAEDEDEEDDENASNAPRRPSSSQVASRSTGTRSDADPLEALSQADPTLAFGLQDDRDGSGSEDEDEKRKRGRGRVPMTREVSMGTLRRLAEENQLEEDKKKGKKSGEETTTTSGLSRAGGFKNFLQLAPSTVATDLDSEEPLEEESEPHRPPSAIDEEEGEYDEEEGEEEQEDDGQQQQDEMEEQAAEAAQVPVPQPAGTDIGEQHERDEQDGGDEPDQSLAAFAVDPHATPRPRDSGGAYGKRRSKDAAPAGNDDDGAEEQEQDEEGEDDQYNDLDAFMFPDSHNKNKRALDSPGLSDNDPLAREAFGVITGRGIGRRGGKPSRGGGGDGRLSPSKFRLTGYSTSTSGGAAPSESFLPGAASDASVRPLLGSIVGRNISDESGNTGVTRSTNMVRLLDPKRIVEEANEDEEAGKEGEEEEQQEQDDEEQDDEEQQQAVADEGEEGDRSFDSNATPRAQHHAGGRNKPSASRSRSPTSTKATPGISSNTADPTQASSNAPLQRSASSRPAARKLPSTDNIGAASTSTDLGLAEIAGGGGGGDDQQSEKYSVAPGPQWVGAAPPPGSTSQHTANLRHQYLRQQRQQALQSQRERMQQQRGQRRGGGGEDADTPAPLARGAQQRPPFPGAPGAGAGTRRPPGPPPNRRSRSSSGKMRDINGVPAAAAVTVGPATGEDEEEEEGEEEEEDDAARALYDQVKDLARDGGELDEGEEEEDGEGEDGELPEDEDAEGEDEEQDQEGEANGDLDGQDDDDEEQADLQANGEHDDDDRDAGKISSPRPSPTPPLQHKRSNVSTSRHSDPQGQHNHRSGPAPPPVPPSLPFPAAAMPPSPATPSTSLDPNRLSPTFTRPALNQRQQPDRLHASQAAHRRRLVLQALQRRNAQVESLLRWVVAIINDQGAEDDPHFAGAGGAGALPVMGESDFLRLAREAYRACEREKDERIANGAGGGGHGGGGGSGPRRGRAATADDPGAGMSGRDVMSGKAKGVVSGGGNRDDEEEKQDDNEDEAERAAMMPLAMGEGEEDGEEGDGYDEEEIPEGIEAL